MIYNIDDENILDDDNITDIDRELEAEAFFDISSPFMQELQKELDEELKHEYFYIPNPKRYKEFFEAYNFLVDFMKNIDERAEITYKGLTLQPFEVEISDVMAINVITSNIVAFNSEVVKFANVLALADNFEFQPLLTEQISISLQFNDVFKKVKKV